MTRSGHDVVIVGSGLAGAATAFALARTTRRSILLVEQETELARHSSGRNAGLVRRSTGDPELDAYCDEGAEFLAAPPPDFGGTTGFRRTGSWLVMTPAQAQAWQRPGIVPATFAALTQALPPYVPPIEAALLHCAADGVADPCAVVAGFVAGARAHGVEVALGAKVGALVVAGGRVAGVTLAGRRHDCRVVVDACGAWAGGLGRAAGGRDPGVTPRRRHLLQTAVDRRIDPAWPWVWDHVRGFYARTAQGGWLICGCDESPSTPSDCAADPAEEQAIRAKLALALPSFRALATARFWAGHRTRRPDERFVLGPDATLGGLHFACGLGGHGLTASAAVGAAVAAAVERTLAAA